MTFSSAGWGPPQAVALSQTFYSGSFSADNGCSGIASGSIAGLTLTVAGVSAGTCTITVTGGNSQTAPVAVTVQVTPTPVAPTPTPGPLVLTPSSVTFPSTGWGSPQAITLSETNYSGPFSAGACGGGTVASGSVTGSTLTVTPLLAGSCTITATGWTTVTAPLSVTVQATPGPLTATPTALPIAAIGSVNAQTFVVSQQSSSATFSLSFNGTDLNVSPTSGSLASPTTITAWGLVAGSWPITVSDSTGDPTATVTANVAASSAYFNAVYNDHPTLWWRLAEPSVSTSTIDATGNGYTGQAGYTQITQGAAGLIYQDAGTSYSNATSGLASTSFATIAAASGLQPTSAVTLEAWIKPQKASTYAIVASYGTSNVSPYDNYKIDLESNGTFAFQVAVGGAYHKITGGSWSTGNIYHVVGTYNGATQALYVNSSSGTPAATASLTGSLGNYTTNGFRVGSDSQGTSEFVGSISNVAIYAGTALTPTQVANHYTLGSPPAPPPSTFYPNFIGYNLVGSNPALAANSAAAIAEWSGSGGGTITFPNANDASSSFYETTTSDVKVQGVKANQHNNICGNAGTQCNTMPNGNRIYIPANAVGGGNVDGHASILQPDGCSILDTNQFNATNVSKPFTTSSVITMGTMGYTDWCSGSVTLGTDGFQRNSGGDWPGATAGGAGNRLGFSPVSELNAGIIPHALFAKPACNGGYQVFKAPATFGASQSCRNGGTAAIPMGTWIWSDVTPATLATISGLDKATKMICTALNQYGAVISDTNGQFNGLSINALWNEIGTQGAAYTTWVGANMHNGNVTQPTLCFPGGWQNHIHVLANPP